MDRLTPYAYRCGATPIHRMNAGLKLLALLAVSIASFAFGAAGLASSAALIVVSARIAGIPLRHLFSGIRPLLTVTLFVVAARSIGFDFSRGVENLIVLDSAGLREGSLFGLSVLVAFAGGSLLFSTTTTAELREAVGSAEGRLRAPLVLLLRRLPGGLPRRIAYRLGTSKLSLVFSLTLGFLPRVFEVWESAEDARLARGGKRGIVGTAAMIPLVIERLMEMAAETARAMEGRGATLRGDHSERAAKIRASSAAAEVDE